MTEPVIVWFRQDLRLRDQPALSIAAQEGPVVPVYILDDAAPGDWAMGGAQRWWLHHSLKSLGESLADKGSRLILRRGDAVDILRSIMSEIGAERIHAVRHYEPWWVEMEQDLGEQLCLHDGNHLAPIEDIRTGSGKQYRVYSAFWKALCSNLPPDEPWQIPHTLPSPKNWPASDDLDAWNLLPRKPDWSSGFSVWTPGEHAAQLAIDRFSGIVADYDATRNLPSEDGTSQLSPHLHFGEISPRDIWHSLGGEGHALTIFRKELAWRDFTSGVILEIPRYADDNGREKFAAMVWRTGSAAQHDLKAWQGGQTGWPIVDAGMRQLWTIGWMHNRVRMIVASFLTKHLLIDWREGERWFWDCLVDADYGNNSVNWQWVAGTGVDANMFSRVMAPLSQSEKFEAADYIRQWVPELRELPDNVIHDPESAGCRPESYPKKIVGHREGRERALSALKTIR